jgi:uncharacterized protein
MTLVSVAGLLQEAPGATRQVVLHDRYLSLGADIELAGPVEGAFHLQRTNRGILVRGALTVPVRRTCARCLDAFVEEEQVAFLEEFVPTIDPAHGTPLAAPDPDGVVQLIDEHHQIDLTTVMHDELALSEPMHPLCRPDCPGLCPGCGRRLDVGTCACAVEELDPRLEPLARLLGPLRD